MTLYFWDVRRHLILFSNVFVLNSFAVIKLLRLLLLYSARKLRGSVKQWNVLLSILRAEFLLVTRMDLDAWRVTRDTPVGVHARTHAHSCQGCEHRMIEVYIYTSTLQFDTTTHGHAHFCRLHARCPSVRGRKTIRQVVHCLHVFALRAPNLAISLTRLCGLQLQHKITVLKRCVH